MSATTQRRFSSLALAVGLFAFLAGGLLLADVGQPGGTASNLATTGTSVVISSAAPPSAGQVPRATSATAATWQTLTAPRVLFAAASATPVVLTNADALKTFRNTIDVAYTLPASATMTAGDWFAFIVGTSGANYFKVTCAGADTARYLGTTTAGGGYFRSNTEGSTLILLYVGSSEWLVYDLSGTWTYDS